jgi:hypothetical protein
VFGQVKFERSGVYFLEVLVDDVMKLRYTVPIMVVQPPAPAPAPPEPKPQG